MNKNEREADMFSKIRHFAKNRPHALKLGLIGLLVTTVIIGVLALVNGTFAGAFTFSIEWNGTDSAISAGNTQYTYNSSQKEEKLVRLKVRYANTNIEKKYDPGQLIITVPGLKGAYRTDAGKAAAIYADEVSAGTHNYDWSYSWDSDTDVYTFFNNFTLAEGATFSGSFEMIWLVNSRSSINGYTKDIQASFRTTREAGRIYSNTIHYSQTRERDVFTLQINGVPHYSLDGFTVPGQHSDYTIFKYNINGSQAFKARNIKSAGQVMQLRVPKEAIVLNGGYTKVSSDATWDYWEITGSSLWIQYDSYGFYEQKNIIIAYPKAQYPLGTNLQVTATSKGTYEDESSRVDLCTANCANLAEDYNYTDIPGPIYDVAKESYGVHSQFVDAHDSYCNLYGAINALHMPTGAGSYYSRYPFTINYFTNAAGEGKYFDYYDLEFYDDIMDVETTGGALRRLTDDEYSFTSVTIPSNSNLLNINGLPIKANAYPVEVWVRYKSTPITNGFAAYTKLTGAAYDNKFITTSELNFGLPANVVGVKVVIRNLRESIDNGAVSSSAYQSIMSVNYKFHTNATDIRLDSGRVKNNMFLRIFVPDGSGGTKWWNTFGETEYHDESELAIIERDRQIYGLNTELLDREEATLHVLEIPNEFTVSNTITQTGSTPETFYFSGSMATRFSYMEDEAILNNFSMYTILPEGLKLNKLAQDPNTLKDLLSFTGGGFTEAALRGHVTFEVIENYKGTGRWYIAAHFTGLNARPAYVSVSGIPMYKERARADGLNLTVQMDAMALADAGNIGLWYGQITDNQAAPWTDIDRDSNQTERASRSSSALRILNPEGSNLQVNKLIETTYSDGFVKPFKEEGGSYQDEIPLQYTGREYTYQLRLRLGEFQVSGLIIADKLEKGPLMEWQGTLVSVDTSAADAVFGTTAQVYYSAQEKEVYSEGNPTFEPNLADGSWVLRGSWAQPLSAVKSIAIKYPESAIAAEGSEIKVLVHMLAPPESSVNWDSMDESDPYLTENNFAVHYTERNLQGIEMGRIHLPSNDVPAQLMPKNGTIVLKKTDATTGAAITSDGVRFSLYRRAGATPNMVTDKLIGSNLVLDSTGTITLSRLIYGNYYFVETAAPLGYVLPVPGDSNYYIQVALQSENDSTTVQITAANVRKPGQVHLKKVSDRNSAYLIVGAKFALYQNDGTLYNYTPASDLVTGADGTLALSGLPWGAYYLVETEAPEGFSIPPEAENKYRFTINAANDAGDMIALNIKDPQVPADAYLLKYEKLEDGTVTSTPVEGASYDLYLDDGDGNYDNDRRMGYYITDEDGKIHATNLAFGSYYFKERAAEGYFIGDPARIPFSLVPRDVTAGNTVIGLNESTANKTMTTYDQRKAGTVRLQKQDNEGNFVAGALYGLFPAGYNFSTYNTTTGDPLVQTATTDVEGWAIFTNVKWGSYYVREITVPRGYDIDPVEYPVEITRWNVESHIFVDSVDPRALGKVKLVKVSEADESIKLAGAIFSLYRSNGSLYAAGLTTNAQGEIIVTGLPWGSYYFQETQAPSGYGLNSDKIRFSVNNVTSVAEQVIQVTDPLPTYDLTITKRIKKADIVFAHGNPTFLFEITSTAAQNISGKALRYVTAISFDAETVAAATVDGTGYISQTIVLPDLVQGTYTIKEIKTDRYETEAIAVTPTTGGNSVNLGAGTATVVLNATQKTAAVTWSNKKTTQEGGGDTDIQVNVVRKRQILTAIIAYWNGPETVNTETLDRSQLEVIAVYDDGNTRVLGNNEYDLEMGGNPAEPFEGLAAGTYIIDVVYTEGGVTRSDSFELYLDIAPPFTWEVLTTSPVTLGSITYDGTAALTGYFGTSDVVRVPSSVSGEWSGVEYVNVGVSSGTNMTNLERQLAYRKIAGTLSNSGKTYLVTQIGGTSVMGDSSELLNSSGLPLTGALSGANESNATMKLPPVATQIVFPQNAGIKKISEFAFNCATQLGGTIEIPPTVTYIGGSAFQMVGALADSVHIKIESTWASSESPLWIGAYAFYGAGEWANSAELTIDANSYNGSTSRVTLDDSALQRFGNGRTVAQGGLVRTNTTLNIKGAVTMGSSVIGTGEYKAFGYNAGEVTLNFDATGPDDNIVIGAEAFQDAMNFARHLEINLDGNIVVNDRAFASTDTGTTLQSFELNITGTFSLVNAEIKPIGTAVFSGLAYKAIGLVEINLENIKLAYGSDFDSLAKEATGDLVINMKDSAVYGGETAGLASFANAGRTVENFTLNIDNTTYDAAYYMGNAAYSIVSNGGADDEAAGRAKTLNINITNAAVRARAFANGFGYDAGDLNMMIDNSDIGVSSFSMMAGQGTGDADITISNSAMSVTSFYHVYNANVCGEANITLNTCYMNGYQPFEESFMYAENVNIDITGGNVGPTTFIRAFKYATGEFNINVADTSIGLEAFSYTFENAKGDLNITVDCSSIKNISVQAFTWMGGSMEGDVNIKVSNVDVIGTTAFSYSFTYAVGDIEIEIEQATKINERAFDSFAKQHEGKLEINLKDVGTISQTAFPFTGEYNVGDMTLNIDGVDDIGNYAFCYDTDTGAVFQEAVGNLTVNIANAGNIRDMAFRYMASNLEGDINVRLENCTITGDETFEDMGSGAMVDDFNLTIDTCTFKGTYAGAYSSYHFRRAGYNATKANVRIINSSLSFGSSMLYYACYYAGDVTLLVENTELGSLLVLKYLFSNFARSAGSLDVTIKDCATLPPGTFYMCGVSCPSIKLTLTGNITEIGAAAFQSMGYGNGLTGTVTVPTSINIIEADAFENTGNNYTLRLPNGRGLNGTGYGKTAGFVYY
jgi:hypothetical protein